MKNAGLYTPWAARSSGIEWELVAQPPDTNVTLFTLTQAQLDAATQLAFGQALPFVVVFSKSVMAPSELELAFKGTPYAYYETQAVYSQGDSSPIPVIYFMHWGQLRNPGDTDGGSNSVDKAALQANGTLGYAFQVDYKASAVRQPPAMAFGAAFAQQFGGPVEVPPEPPPPPGPLPPPPGPPAPPPPTGPPEAKASLVGPALVGLGAAAATFFAVRAMRKKRK